jgi:hypothetical protein
MNIEDIKGSFFKSFEITNSPIDKIGIHFIRKWCEKHYVSYKNMITPLLNELKCETIKYNGIKYKTGIKAIINNTQNINKENELLYEPCRLCFREPIVNPVQTTGGYACDDCDTLRYERIKHVDVCVECDVISNCDKDTAKLYTENKLTNMRIKIIKCSNCTLKEFVKFRKSGIYIWFCKDLSVSHEYIGKSKQIVDRMISHKNCSNNKDNDTKLYNFIREHGGHENWEFNVLELMPDNISARQQSYWLSSREKWWIERLEPKLNTAFTENPKAVSFLSYAGKQTK